MHGIRAPESQGHFPSRTATLSRPWLLLLTYVLAALELTCLFMQFSTVPYLSRRLGLDSVAFGYLQTTFGVLQLLGGPVFGRFADQRGARAALTLSFLAASTLYLLLAASCSPALPGVPLLFASRLPAALMHTLPWSPEDPRGRALGAESRGARTGPTPAALLWARGALRCGRCGRQDPELRGTVAFRIQYPAIVALMANLLGAVLSFTCIPASTKEASTSAQAAPPGGPKASVFDLQAISRLLLLPEVLPVFLVKVISSFPSGLFMVMFSIISMEFFRLEAAQAGYLMSFLGILQMVTQGLVIGWLSSRFPEEVLVRASVLVFIVVGLAMALMSNVFHFCLLVPGLVFSMGTLNVVTDSMLTKAVAASDTGTMLGLCASVQPLTRTFGPTLGGLLYRSFGVPVFGHVQAAVNILVLLLLWRKPIPRRKDKSW
ncbi:PREDICTED: solute carrier family 22 member 18 [Galeopterus variegatus]|uniref:Solute carrier family 22 member 18 n=1 Tax=Galeopterus variegatus TaxID=482537 RepID=A0ABM0S006_GALVR|nr:PREDICTED: solute carrier family 22 member 18 [Galeopterus variegatus]